MYTYFEVKVRSVKTLDNGKEGKTTDVFLVDAMTFTETEARIIREIKPYAGEDTNIEVAAITKTRYSEIVSSDKESADKWYKCKLSFITLDEVTAKEKRQSIFYLVKGSDLNDAKCNIVEFTKSSNQDYELSAINETPILEVYEYQTMP